MKAAENEASPHNEVELELIKMTSVSRDIRIVIENILDAKDLDKRVDKQLIKTFTIELQSILQNVQLFPTCIKKKPSFKVGDKIAQAQEEEENSESTIRSDKFQFQAMKEGRQSLEANQLHQINQQLAEQNEFLTGKLEQAEEYIKKMQEENSLLQNQLSSMKMDSRLLTKPCSKSSVGYRANTYQYFDDKDGMYAQLVNDNEELRQQLQESKEFILKNNEDFVRELQKYNEKIWRLEREVEESRSTVQIQQDRLEECEMIITRLKQENFNLEVVNRNFKNMMNSDRSMRESNIETEMSQRKGLKVSRLKNFFKKEIQQSFKRKQTD